MLVKYNHPAFPFDGIKLDKVYNMETVGNKAILKTDEEKIEISAELAKTVFQEVVETVVNIVDEKDSKSIEEVTVKSK